MLRFECMSYVDCSGTIINTCYNLPIGQKKNTAAHMRHLMEVVIKVNARHAMLSGPIVSKTGMKIPSTFHCELASLEAFGIG